MINFLARIFRSLNSRIVLTKPGLIRKFLKGTLFVSYRLSHIMPDGENKEILISNFDGDLSLFINTSRIMGKNIFWTGFHEMRELMFLHQFIQRDMVFVDIGANMGEYSLFVSKRVPQGQVFSFEPLPSMLSLLKRNIEHNHLHNITVIPFGLSDRNGKLPIYDLKDKHEGLATLFPGQRGSDAAFEIDLRTLDEMWGTTGPGRIDFIKIDIEGSELFALRGAVHTIEKFHPWVMVEINDSTYGMAGYSSAEIFEFFDQLGYTSFALDKEARLIPNTARPPFANLIFKPS